MCPKGDLASFAESQYEVTVKISHRLQHDHPVDINVCLFLDTKSSSNEEYYQSELDPSETEQSFESSNSIQTLITCSWILISWNLINFEPRVCNDRRPPDLFVTQSWLGHRTSGINVGAVIYSAKKQYKNNQHHSKREWILPVDKFLNHKYRMYMLQH